MLLMASLALASLFYFNRNADWDNWALYFMGAYTLGAVTSWASQTGAGHGWRWLAVLLVLQAWDDLHGRGPASLSEGERA